MDTVAELDEARKSFIESEQQQWLTIDEAALVLRVSPNFLTQAILDDHIPLFAFGRVRRIHSRSLVECQKKFSEWASAR